jgi:hypothetical protein
VRIEENDKEYRALLDIGTEMNLISENVQKKYDLTMRIDIPMIVQAHGEATSEIIGICPEVKLNFRGARVTQELVVYCKTDNPILFSQSFLITADFDSVRKEDGQWARITADDGSETVKVKTFFWNDKRNRNKLVSRSGELKN